jgi:general secretion pathway protein G
MKPSIISSLAIVVLVFFLCDFLSRISDNPQMSRCVKMRQDLHALVTGLEIFKKSTGRYPSTGEGLNILLKENIFEKIPKDPWGSNYFYSAPAKLNNMYSFDLLSFGENKINNYGTGDDYVSWGDVDCTRNVHSCLFIATVYFGLPVFVVSLIISERKYITTIFIRRKRVRGNWRKAQ